MSQHRRFALGILGIIDKLWKKLREGHLQVQLDNERASLAKTRSEVYVVCLSQPRRSQVAGRLFSFASISSTLGTYYTIISSFAATASTTDLTLRVFAVAVPSLCYAGFFDGTRVHQLAILSTALSTASTTKEKNLKRQCLYQ